MYKAERVVTRPFYRRPFTQKVLDFIHTGELLEARASTAALADEMRKSDMTRCDIVKMSAAPDPDNLGAVPVSSNAAYVYTDAGAVFYIDKEKKEATSVRFLDDTAKKIFLDILKPTAQARSLSNPDLENIERLSDHRRSLPPLSELRRFAKEQWGEGSEKYKTFNQELTDTEATRDRVHQESLKKLDQALEKVKKERAIVPLSIAERFADFTKTFKEVNKALQDNYDEEVIKITKLADDLKLPPKALIDQATHSHKEEIKALDAIHTKIHEVIHRRQHLPRSKENLAFFQNLYLLSLQPASKRKEIYDKLYGKPDTELTDKEAEQIYADELKARDFPELIVSHEGGFIFDDKSIIHISGNSSSFSLPRDLGSSAARKIALDCLSADLTSRGAPAGCDPHDKTLTININLPPNLKDQDRGQSQQDAINLMKEEVFHACVNHGYKIENVRLSLGGQEVTQQITGDIEFVNRINTARQAAVQARAGYEEQYTLGSAKP